MGDDLRQTSKADDSNVDQGSEVKKRVTDAFHREADGSWTCLEDVTAEHAGRQIRFAKGAVFHAEDTFMGVKVAKWLDSLSDARHP